MELYKKIIDEISLDRIYKDMAYLVNQVGERLSGTKEMKKATQYIYNQLMSNNIDAYIDHFPMYQSYPKEASLKIIEPFEKVIKTKPVCHIESTPSTGIEGEVIYLGSGSYDDYKDVDVKDKIILTNMDWSPGRPEKAKIAWEKGAKALIIMNWGKADDELIQMGAVKSQWGNPTPETEKDIVKLTVLSISRKDGEFLANLCSEHKVKVWLSAEATREWITADQPIGRIHGGQSNGQYILVGSHVDAWGKSAICNASGNALNLEIARIFHKYRKELKRDIVFTFWDGHEIAEGGGSTWYCDTYWQDLNENCIAYINIDNIAIKGTSIPGVEGQPEMKALLMDSIKEIWDQPGIWHHAYKGGGDSSFFGVGVPYISFATEYSKSKLEELNYAFYSPWLHSSEDTLDKIDENLLLKHAHYFINIICKLVNNNIVPYELPNLAIDIESQWQEILKRSQNAEQLIKDITPLVSEYVKSMEKLWNYRNCCDFNNLYNKVVIYCERQLSVFRCEAGRYGQDPCCSLQTENPIPVLEKAIKEYNNSEPNTHNYYLWETEILKVKHIVYDALYNCIEIINMVF